MLQSSWGTRLRQHIMAHGTTDHTISELIPAHNARLVADSGVPAQRIARPPAMAGCLQAKDTLAPHTLFDPDLCLGALAHTLAAPFGLLGFVSGSEYSPARHPGAGLCDSISKSHYRAAPLISLGPNRRWSTTSYHRAEHLLPRRSPPRGPHGRANVQCGSHRQVRACPPI